MTFIVESVMHTLYRIVHAMIFLYDKTKGKHISIERGSEIHNRLNQKKYIQPLAITSTR